MANLTRDIFHPLVASLYCNNLNDLIIKVDGEQVESRTVVNVYTTAFERPSYIQVWSFDDDGQIICDENDQPIIRDIEGAITVDGHTTSCGCWMGRRSTKRWWKRIEQGLRGW